MPRYYNNMPAGYDVSKINGVVFDFDPASGINIDPVTGVRVVSWQDVNGYLASLTYNLANFIFDPVAMNGLPGLRSEGVTGSLRLNLAAQEACRAQTGGTLIIVASMPNDLAASRQIFQIANGLSTASTRQAFGFAPGQLPNIAARRRDNDGIYNDLATGQPFTINNVDVYVIEWNYVNDGTVASYTISKNGTIIYGPQTVATSNAATHTITAGTTPLGGISGSTVVPTPSLSVEIGGSFANSAYIKSRIGRLTYIKRILSPREKSLIVNARMVERGMTGCYIYSPDNYQMYQVGTNGTASIPITGAYTGSVSAIQARVTGITVGGAQYTSAWTSIVTSPTGGTFSGTLTGIPQGYYTLQARQSNISSIQFSRFKVLVSDVFVLYGQSNNTDQVGADPQSCDCSSGLTASQLPDPTQIPYTTSKWALNPSAIVFNGKNAYAVNFDVNGTPAYWALFAKAYFDAYKVPCGLIAAAIGGQNIDKLSPAGGGYTFPGVSLGDQFGVGQTAYARMLSMVSLATAGTGCKRMLYHQGEANSGNTDSATYQTKLTALAGSVQTDLGVQLMPCTLQKCITSGGISYDQTTPYTRLDINNAIRAAWAAPGNNIVQGPDFADLSADKDPNPANGYVHLLKTANQMPVAKRWANANAVIDNWPVKPQL